MVYVTGEQFANEFIDASRTQNGQSFTKLRRKYRKADVLLVDDVQFISGKEKRWKNSCIRLTNCSMPTKPS